MNRFLRNDELLLFHSLGVALVLALGHPLSAAEPDLSQLPPPADRSVQYETDILPIFEQNCFRCHGAANPKSDFSLATRETALHSGTFGENILPGDSTKSPLIHFVARLVEDSEMPPIGEGDPLTRGQVALLRAWIDQGVSYGSVRPPPRLEIEFTPAYGFYFVDGDEAKFREHQWVNDGWQGGVDSFMWTERIDDRTRAEIRGHALRDDYEFTVSFEKKDAGFVRAGWEQFRRYYDDGGGYDESFTPSFFELDRELFLDLGTAWVEAGWDRPGFPRFVIGYEHHYKDGEKSTTQWLPVVDPGLGIPRDIFPATKQVDERRHVLRVDVSHTLAGMDVEDNFRYEFYDLETSRRGVLPSPIDATGDFVNTTEGQDYHRLANTLTARKQMYDWLLVSGGYLYSRMFDGEASFRQDTMDGSASPAFGQYWTGNEITFDQHAHVMNANAQAGPWQGLTLSAGVLPEWSRQEGLGDVNLDEGTPPLVGTEVRPAVIRSDYDHFSVEEHAALRFTKIPFTVLFAEGRLKQETIGQFESKAGVAGNTDTVNDFARDTDAEGRHQDYRAGFHVSPWSRVALAAHYRYRERDNEYHHRRDEQSTGGGPLAGYPAFIRELESQTDEVEGKLTLKPLGWLKTSLTLRWESTDYETATDAAPPFAPGGTLSEAGDYDSRGFGLNVVLTPWRRLFWSSTFSFSESRLRAFDNEVRSVAPYEGQTYAVLQTATWTWDDKTDLTATYAFSHGNYDQNNGAAGVPLGIKYYQHGVMAGLRRQWTDRVSSRLQYGFFQYDEPSAGGRNDYTAHGVLASVTVRLP